MEEDELGVVLMETEDCDAVVGGGVGGLLPKRNPIKFSGILVLESSVKSTATCGW